MTKKTIFITGAASGIGWETALLFGNKGWFVGLFDVNESSIAELSRRIGQEKSCYRKMDVSNPEQVRAAVDCFASHTHGKMDALFNCAGILRMGFFKEIPLEEQINIVNINVTGIINCIYSAFDLMKQTPGAHIVNMCSASALYGSPELAVYSATKFAVHGLTQALNIEFERDDIIVCDIMVPYVNTPMLNQERKAGSIKSLGVHLKPEEIAGLVWKAVNGKKVHWSKGMKHLMLLSWLFPFARKAAVKFVLK